MPGDLHYGDNLGILRRRIPSESVDLVYLDPPFNSDRIYSLIHRPSLAKQEAFGDSWRWDDQAVAAFAELTGETPPAIQLPPGLSDILVALKALLWRDRRDTLAYLSMMAIRLVELQRVLRSTGTLFLHCDPTASHYLKILLDSIFGEGRFENEIVWQRSTGKALQSRRLPNNHDVILVYSKGDARTWNPDETFAPYDPENLDGRTLRQYARLDADGRRYTLGDLVNPNLDRPNLTYEFLGIERVWRWTKRRMIAAHGAGLVVQSRPGCVPRIKRYLDQQRGKPLGDVWTDVAPLSSHAKERIGYPTQKPVALLERIVRMASRPGDLVLDPFCGCGTTIEAAEALGRRWIGIDQAIRAVDVVKERLDARFERRVWTERRSTVRLRTAQRPRGGGRDECLPGKPRVS
jgi:site-specific DNA-methyltransferase (adenine-specific)